MYIVSKILRLPATDNALEEPLPEEVPQAMAKKSLQGGMLLKETARDKKWKGRLKKCRDLRFRPLFPSGF